MNVLINGLVVATITCAGFALSVSALGSDRTADQVLAEIDALKPTKPDPKLFDDPATAAEYKRQVLRMRDRRDELIWELYQAHPDHERVPALLHLRWMHRFAAPGSKAADDAIAEIDRVLSERRGTRLATDLAFLRAEAVLRNSVRKDRDRFADVALPAIADAVRHAPHDPRGANLLFMLLLAGPRLPERTRNEIEARILKDYPDSTAATALTQAQNQRKAVGKPFVLEFSDAIKGATVSTKDLRGKVVVIIFWATWCGPCIAEMPRMKELHDRYHAPGVEFIGVSWDHSPEKGGLDRLREFVAKNGISWPQFYEGGAGEGAFSRAHGVLTIPTVFVVDRDGKLASIDARGKLDELLPALLKAGGQSAAQD